MRRNGSLALSAKLHVVAENSTIGLKAGTSADKHEHKIRGNITCKNSHLAQQQHATLIHINYTLCC